MFTRLAPTKPPFDLRMAFALLDLYDPCRRCLGLHGMLDSVARQTVLEALEIMSSVTYFLALSATVPALYNAAGHPIVLSLSL